ncbi:MAG: hypothetical protein LBS63_03765 [Prevotellaceae bacterium]|jgi:endonuclease/exonuclease/phosphatase family metal-dependent hydrolase|nr:hypothetical protein [Prevotellaceae bacterium]
MARKKIWLGLAVVAALARPVAVFFAAATIAAYRPAPQEPLRSHAAPPYKSGSLADSFTVTSWNIGYGGLGREADFFYDGGKMVRSPRAAVENNLLHIEDFLQADGSNFLLLQEVDTRSRRSYNINELRRIAARRRGSGYFFAHNYKAWHVPVPLFDPLGHVRSGVATFGQCPAYSAVRHAYPFGEPYPQSIFQLRRCFLACRYAAKSGKKLLLVNTHNSAFDSGQLREAEMNALRDFAVETYESGCYVVVGGDWNQTPPGYEKWASTKEYTPHPIARDLLPQGWQWAYDTAAATMRFANAPYDEGTSLTSTVDFFLASPNVHVAGVAAHRLGFEHADHNPVTATFVLR